MSGKIKTRKILRVATKMVLQSERIRKDRAILGRKAAAKRLIATKYYLEKGVPEIQKGFFGVKKVKFDDMQYPTELYLLDRARRLECKLESIGSRPHTYETLINITRVYELVHRTKVFYQNGHTDEEFDERAEEFMDFVEKHIVTRGGAKTFRIAGREDVRKREKRPDGKTKTLDDYLDENRAYYNEYKKYLNKRAHAEEKEI